MAEASREYRPLLEDFADDELRASHFCPQKRFHHSARARNKLKGAAAIITRWPDYWSSSVLFWWVVVGLLVLTIMVIYNTVVALFLIPSISSMSLPTETTADTKDVPDVNMHVFVESNEIVDLKYYLPFVNKLANKYDDFNFNFVVLLNDSATAVSRDYLENFNQIAVNEILSDNVVSKRAAVKNGIFKVKHAILSEYLDNSPLKHKWRNIHSQFIPFIVRIVSIWENGGIAIDPSILTPHSSNQIYNKKIIEVMTSYRHPKIFDFVKVTKTHHAIPKKMVNNIQDIIYGSESEHDYDKSEINLSEAEEQVVETETKAPSELKHVTNKSSSDSSKNSTDNFQQDNSDLQESVRTKRSPIDQDNQKSETHSHENTQIKTNEKAIRPIIVLPNDDAMKPVEIVSNHTPTKISSEKLVIDLKGKFVATPANCHAFIGTVFHDIETHSSFTDVTDFIIRELTKFCNGVLTSCKGIDVILA